MMQRIDYISRLLLGALMCAGLYSNATSVGAHEDGADTDIHINSLFQQDYGLTADEIATQLEDQPLDYSTLHTYDELVSDLYKIEATSHGSIDVGPLIRNGSNQGLVDIDIAYGDTSLRQAIVNTVANDNQPNLGNTDPAKIGLSNMGRNIMAARFGHGPTKVVYITQQHGNEFIETEAAFDFLKRIGRTHFYPMNRLQEKITLLMIVRANPDGGEPNPERCQMGTPFPIPSSLTYDCAFYRFNIDPSAGTLPTDDPFRGAVGVGYNLNRYHVANLDKPIRPVEAQAMVAAIKAFKPNYILDFHGDVPKVTCEINQESMTSVIPGLLYDSACENSVGSKLNDISVRDMAEFLNDKDVVAQRWNGLIANGLKFFGVKSGRHRQFNEATEILNTAGDYSKLIVDGEPTHTMLLEMKNYSPVADLFVAGLDFSTTPVTPQIDFTLNGVIGKRSYFVGKIVSEIIMFKGLWVLFTGQMDSTQGNAGYYNIPTDTGFLYQLGEVAQHTLGLDHPGPYIFPLCQLQSCLGEEGE
ncbi:MAG: hypothetical protein MI976_27150 [Pseudomonadales bacterium]|nr:hypothetical protein [Pseudomonadales bacterium]